MQKNLERCPSCHGANWQASECWHHPHPTRVDQDADKVKLREQILEKRREDMEIRVKERWERYWKKRERTCGECGELFYLRTLLGHRRTLCAPCWRRARCGLRLPLELSQCRVCRRTFTPRHYKNKDCSAVCRLQYMKDYSRMHYHIYKNREKNAAQTKNVDQARQQ